VDERRDHIIGTPTALVTLVEYGDYECPYCQQAHFVLQELMTQLSDQVRLVFRNFPLAEMHPHAARAAEAAECASAQGAFWDMHDTLYERQQALEDEDLVSYAAELALDLKRFQFELFNGIHRPRVRQDFMSGVRSGVNGTPSFFINGERHDGPWDLYSLSTAVTARIPLPRADDIQTEGRQQL
jgi:protein-disulfide isomerase